ncbi:MAG: GNAT family N-acetyltransferase [Bacteroidia bacterium]
MNLILRKAIMADVPSLMELVKELALFERAPEKVSNTISQMEQDGFGPEKIFDAFVVEHQGEVIATAITYYRYSTWRGKCLYLEDLIVKEKHRGNGAGQLLFDACVKFGKEQNCEYMNWQVLDWNTPAIDFYKRYGTEVDHEWLNCSLALNV